MSWGTELWDQFDNISAHTQKGIDFCERYSHFVKERCAIESDYALKLKRLVKSYLPKGDKKRDDDTFTCSRGFYAMVKEVNDFAGQREVICENLTNTVLRELQSSIQENKQERKRLLAEVVKQQNILQSQMSQLERARSKYEKAFREAEKAQEVYKKAEADIHMTKADIEKTKQVMHTKVQISDDCKAEYAVEIQKTNDVQRDHYGNTVPQLFNQLQDMEEKRVTKVQNLITSSADIERQVMPIISKCIDGVTAAATIINSKEDSRLMIDRYKTGFLPPGDVPFEDLSNTAASQGNNGSSKADASNRLAGTAAVRGKKRGGFRGIFGAPKAEEAREDFGHLPPTQQKKQLTMKIDSLKANLAKETSESHS